MQCDWYNHLPDRPPWLNLKWEVLIWMLMSWDRTNITKEFELSGYDNNKNHNHSVGSTVLSGFVAAFQCPYIYFFMHLCVNVPVWPLWPLCSSPGWSLCVYINLTVKRGGPDLWCFSFKAGQFQSEQSAVVSNVTCKFRTLLIPWSNCFVSGANKDLQITEKIEIVVLKWKKVKRIDGFISLTEHNIYYTLF